MDNKEWVYANRLSKEYWDGVGEFIRLACRNHADDRGFIVCPCVKCGVVRHVHPETCEEHLVAYGFDQSYTCWTKHGEEEVEHTDDSRANLESRCDSPILKRCEEAPNLEGCDSTNPLDDADRLKDLADAIEGEFSENPEKFERMKRDAEKPLYENCTEFTLLSAVLNLYNWKARYGLSDAGFTELLSLLRKMLPPGNDMPTKTYDAKQVMRTVGLSYEKIHACPNDCILFRKEYESLTECPLCSASRYQANGKSPMKALWYLPIKLDLDACKVMQLMQKTCVGM